MLPLRFTLTAVLFGASAFGAPPAGSLAAGDTASPLDLGYRHMYNLQFDRAHRVFEHWENAHPEDPMGPVSDAAAYLFAEFDRLRILQSEFFVRGDYFHSGQQLEPDPQLKRAFGEALDKARQLADRRLARNPGDEDAIFASILRLGLDADYRGLIDKSYMASLGAMKTGRALAEQLLAQDPAYYDAYLAIGVENYVLSLKPAPLRWLLRLGGAQTDRQQGLRKLKLTAERGHYLLPYARLLLAVAALRDHDRNRARALLADLSEEFPRNRLYREELARLR